MDVVRVGTKKRISKTVMTEKGRRY